MLLQPPCPGGFSQAPPRWPCQVSPYGALELFFSRPPPPPPQGTLNLFYASPSDVQRVFQADPDDLLSQHPRRCRNWGPSSFQNFRAAGVGRLLRARVLAGLARSSKDRRVRPGTPADPRRPAVAGGAALGRRQAERGPAESQRARSDRNRPQRPLLSLNAPCTRHEGCLSQNTLPSSHAGPLGRLVLTHGARGTASARRRGSRGCRGCRRAGSGSGPGSRGGALKSRWTPK